MTEPQDKGTPRPLYRRASEALDAAHKACFNHPGRDVLGMSHGPFSGVNVALGIVSGLEHENAVLRTRLRAAVNSHDAMKEALKFYADPQTWQLDGAAPISTAPIRSDRGDRARSALDNLGVETGSAIEAPREMSGMKECVEALKAAQSFVEEYRETRDPGGVLIVASKINAVLAKLEKANG